MYIGLAKQLNSDCTYGGTAGRQAVQWGGLIAIACDYDRHTSQPVTSGFYFLIVLIPVVISFAKVAHGRKRKYSGSLVD